MKMTIQSAVAAVTKTRWCSTVLAAPRNGSYFFCINELHFHSKQMVRCFFTIAHLIECLIIFFQPFLTLLQIATDTHCAVLISDVGREYESVLGDELGAIFVCLSARPSLHLTSHSFAQFDFKPTKKVSRKNKNRKLLCGQFNWCRSLFLRDARALRNCFG